ncbi:verrucotoxin subunit beta-like [Polypterus senegalus]|uniref:verrucotoxin subunit beta-like n=1 Tax=Polypterus senegalus TaxID=55291 RepID=UPI0019636792|nr:verrucotoxin subunit beta-like [Polypterus senegalus]
MAALGRPFQVGMLYDCRTDSLIPGVTLWDLENLKKNLNIKPQKKTQFKVITSDSLDEKTSILNVIASLKASFLCGLIEVDGSAKYLNDTKSSKRQSRVTLHYSTTTRMEQLSMSHLGNQNVDYPEVFEQKSATHVVTAVLYGAQAFFVFDQSSSKEEERQEIKGKLALTITKFISVKAKGDLKMTDEEKKTTDHLNCTFYGDFALDHNPASFQEAMEIYTELPTKLGKDYELTVPIQVWLYPLKYLYSQAAQLVRDISVALVSKSQEVLEEIDEHIMRCNDIMKDSVVNDFPEIGKNTDQFKSILNLFKCNFQRDLASVLPSIRGGGANEKDLADILKKKEESPFKRWAITTWLDKREKEITMLRSFLNQIKERNVNIVINDLNELLYDTRIDNIVCLTFTSLHVCQSYMSEMESYLQAPSRESSDKSSEPSEELIIEKFRQHSRWFIEFAEINQDNETMRFLVHSKPDIDYLGATIYLYQSGQLKNRDFHIPSKPEPLVFDSQTLNAITLKLRCIKSDSEVYRVEYKRTEDEEWETVDTSNKNEIVMITKLRPASTYQLRHRAVCQVGVSQASDTIEVKIPPAKHHAAKLTIKQKCQEIKDGNPGLYLLPLKSEFINNEKKIRKCTFGERTSNKTRKTIMVLGATGSGKSTLINGMVNYILGVEWEDDFRFKLIHEETSRNQAASQTSAVTVYEMNYQDCYKVPYSFTIVDTPGFGDTRGIHENRKLIDQIAEYLSSTHTFQHINAICFVVQNFQAELTQKYIFDSVLSIFGKDIANNVLVLITFADGRRPPVLDAITESNIPFHKDDKGKPFFFRFNNSVLFANNDESNSSDDQMFDKIFWDMGAKSMEKLFMCLEKMDSKSLALTKEVIKERKRLETAVGRIGASN